MTLKLKKLLGEAGAGFDKSMGIDDLRGIIVKLIEVQKELEIQYNQLNHDWEFNFTIPITAPGPFNWPADEEIIVE